MTFIILSLVYAFVLYFLIRVKFVLDFRNNIINAIFSVDDEEKRINLLTEFLNVSFAKMAYSFKKLTIENYYSISFQKDIKCFL